MRYCPWERGREGAKWGGEEREGGREGGWDGTGGGAKRVWHTANKGENKRAENRV
jgi:hypothetical protein